MYGHTIKKIREDKGLKQKDICQNIVTISYYSCIERNTSNPTIDVFLKIIKNLNVSIEEFMYIHNNYQKPLIDHTWFDISELYHMGDINGLKTYKSSILEGEVGYEDSMMIEMINLFITRLEGRDSQANTTSIVQSLMKLENWTSREVKIFITIMDEVPIENLIIIVNFLLKKRNLYTESKSYDSPYSKILINSILICIDTKYLNEACSYIEILENMLEVHDLYGKTMSLYLGGLLDYANGKKSEGEKKINDSFEIFHLLNMEYFSHKYKLYFEHIKTKY